MWSQIISSILFSRCSIWIKYQPNPGYGNPPEALDFAYIACPSQMLRWFYHSRNIELETSSRKKCMNDDDETWLNTLSPPRTHAGLSLLNQGRKPAADFSNLVLSHISGLDKTVSALRFSPTPSCFLSFARPPGMHSQPQKLGKLRREQVVAR